MGTNSPIQLDDRAWVVVYTGPTSKPISVQPGTDKGTIWIAISDAVPQFSAAGHTLFIGEPLGVELDEGEQLYAYAAPLARSHCSLVITD